MKRKPGTLVPLETSILAAALELQRDGTDEFHGFQLASHLADAVDKRRLTAYGTLYRALARLEQMNLLTSRWEDPQLAATQGRPLRRLYTVTSAGTAAIGATVRHPGAKARPAARRKAAPA